MAKESAEVIFIVHGQALPNGQRSALVDDGQVKAAARPGARRSDSRTVRIAAKPDADIVVLHLANGPALYLHPEHARELFRAQVEGSPRSAHSVIEPSEGDAAVSVPAQLSWRGLSDPTQPAARGGIASWIGNVVLDGIEVVTGLFKDKTSELLGDAIVKRIDSQVDAGVYQLSPAGLRSLKGSAAPLAEVPKPPRAEDPLLILIHGTFVETSSTFGKLWTTHTERVKELFDRYGGRVYALDHPTVGVGPFANALTLVESLPMGARLHLVTHSRGGIVAEVLARLCGGQGSKPEDFALFGGEGYEEQLEQLRKLVEAIAQRQIKVERIVRVACPVRGTLLASRRLDAYLSVLKWGLELSGTAVLPQFADFLAGVARCRADPTQMPGLEAMMPESPLVKWLNAPADPIEGELLVVAGDLQGDSLSSWLKMLLADAFYWTDNDLVVQTRSMYGGTPRAADAARFALDRGGKVTHFNYFANARTADLITRGLLDAQPELFRPIGPLSWAGEDAGGARAQRAVQRSRTRNVATVPAVFVLPGILGSHLKVGNERVWLSLRFVGNLDRLAWSPHTANNVAADGPVGVSYDDLIDHLADSHEVVPFSFDWRRPIEDEARRLADAVEQALSVRDGSGQPVRFVAHSMGGIVLRTMLLERPEVWAQCIERQGCRVLLLGTPNAGSFAPMQVLSGDDSFGNLFTLFGGLFSGSHQRQLVAEMPGLIQLQAGLLDAKLRLGEAGAWQELARADLAQLDQRHAEGSLWHDGMLQRQALDWGVPPQHVLDQAVRLRRRLDQQIEDFGVHAAHFALVVGRAKGTPAAIKTTPDGVVYLDAPDGDGRVTLASAVLPGVKTWQVDVPHGQLADVSKAFDAYVELLATGTTDKLREVSARASRGAAGDALAALVPSRPARSTQAAAPPTHMSEVLAVQSALEPTRATGNRLRVRVVNGNLKFVREPLLIGHYSSLKLTGTEWVIDQLLNNKMSEALRAGSYPSVVGSSQVFTNARNTANPLAMPRPRAAIIVGLGEEGALVMSKLVEAIRQGTLAYSQRLAEHGSGSAATFELATTLVGSGGTSISPGTAAQAAANGVREANLLLADAGWPVVSCLQLIELYLDRATEAFNALRALSDGVQDLSVEPIIAAGQGGLRRPLDSGYRGQDYDFVSVRQRGVQGGTGGSAEFEFALSTRRARDEVRGTIAQSKLVDELVSAGASDANDDPRVGRTLFKLMVPVELEPFLAGSTSLVLQLDPATAAYPWEMLDLHRSEIDRNIGMAPWAIRTGLLRKLRTQTFREAPRTAAADDGVLVIGEPQCRTDLYPRLPGAADEAKEVAAIFGTHPILNAEALTIVNSVMDRSHAILHVAGHGNIVEGIGGVVLSNDATFGAREVKAMRVVPQLAFINCCHLGRIIPKGGLPKFAANVAEELIRIGVQCVIAAGWAVDDAAARLFARTFYKHIARGIRFGDAVSAARKATQEQHPHSNTWAAYQCYGDPDWIYQPSGVTDQPVARAVPVVGSAQALLLHLQTLLAEHKFEARKPEQIRTELEHLASLAPDSWISQGDVAAAFGAVHAEIKEFAAAIRWYERAAIAADGSASLRTLEQVGNLKAQFAKTPKEALAAIDVLKQVRAMGATLEREALLGSAYKRLAGIQSQGDQRDSLLLAYDHYRAAEKLAREQKTDNLFYPAMNRMRLELQLRTDQPWQTQGFDPEDIRAVRESLQAKHSTDPEFWSAISIIELSIYEAVALGELAARIDEIILQLDDLQRRVTSEREWESPRYEAGTLRAYLDTPNLSAEEADALRRLLKWFGIEATAASSTAASQRKSRKTRRPPRKQPGKRIDRHV